MDVASFARGYLSLIGSQDRGRGVSQAADFLQPVVNLQDYLGCNFRSTDAGQIANYVNASALVTIPTGEVWDVKNVTARILTPPAGVVTQGRLGFQDGNFPGGELFVMGDAIDCPINTTSYLGFSPPFRWLAPAGTEFNLVCRAIDINVQVRISVLFDRLRV